MHKTIQAYVAFVSLVIAAVLTVYWIWRERQPKPESEQQQVVSFCKTDKCPTLPMQVPEMIKLPQPCYLDQASTPVFCPRNLEVFPSPEPPRAVHTIRVPPPAEQEALPPPATGPIWHRKQEQVPLPRPRPNIIVEVKPAPKPSAAKPKAFPAPKPKLPALKQWPDTIRNDLP